MTGPSLDLDALRKKAEKALILLGRGAIEGSPTWCDVQDVFALIDEQRGALDRLLPYSDHLRTCAITEKRPPGVCTCGYLDALAGSPAENKEPSCPACKGAGSYKRIVARRAITVDCPHCNGTGKA